MTIERPSSSNHIISDPFEKFDLEDLEAYKAEIMGSISKENLKKYTQLSGALSQAGANIVRADRSSRIVGGSTVRYKDAAKRLSALYLQHPNIQELNRIERRIKALQL